MIVRRETRQYHRTRWDRVGMNIGFYNVLLSILILSVLFMSSPPRARAQSLTPDQARTRLVLPPTPDILSGTWMLVWSDEFDGSGYVDANGLNMDNWVYETDVHVNHEQQQYTSAISNVQVISDTLRITAHYEPTHPSGYDFTSGRIISKDRHEFAYGRFEARIKLPVGEGLWPAFWLLGANIGAVGWPQCGEIDIMENIGYENWISGAAHGPGHSGAESLGGRHTFADSATVADWHVYRVEWGMASIQWYVDDRLFYSLDRATWERTGGTWVFDHPYYVILNLALGGDYPFAFNHATDPYYGLPQATIDTMPHTMQVDWVRVYQHGIIYLPLISRF